MSRPAVPLLLMALVLPVGAQTLTRVRVEAVEAPRLAHQLLEAGLDVLEPTIGPGSFEAIVDAAARRRLESSPVRVIELAVGRPFAEIQREQLAGAPDGGVPSGYPTLAQIQAQLAATAAAFPAIAELHDLTLELGAAPTADGRHVFAVKISDNVALDEDEPAALIVSNHHAREIGTPLIALHALGRLTNEYGANPTLTQLVDQNEIWIAPVWNPDGYVYVFNVDNWWRKNRRNNGDGTFGVDLNRNYPFGWDSPCAGTTDTSSETYRGPSPGSEAETQTMLLFGEERRFAKLFDYHSFASEVRYGYGCWSHPWISFLAAEAQAFSLAGGYGGNTALSCCTAGDIHWHGAHFGTHAFLWETHTDFQPPYSSAQAEAAMLFPGMVALLQRPIPLWGHVTDAFSSQSLEAQVEVVGADFQNGEVNGSGGPFGRYQIFLPPGTWNVRFSAPCFQDKSVQVTVGPATTQKLDVALQPAVSPTLYCTAKPTSIPGCLPALSFSGVPSASAGSGFTAGAGPVPGQNLGIFFYTTQGAAAVPAQTPFGWLCIQSGPGLFRIQPALNGGGTSAACDGQYQLDFNQYIATQTQDPSLVAGAQVDLQAWYRDPPNTGAANLTGAGSFQICP